MIPEYTYSPHYDFYIDRAQRDAGYDMRTFHFHKKYEIYYQVDGTRRYYIDDSAYLVNVGNIVLIGPDSIHKTGSVDNVPYTRLVINFNREYLQELTDAFVGVDFFSCFDAGINVLQVSARRQTAIALLMSRIWEQRDETGPREVAARKLQLAELLLHLGEYVDEAVVKQAATGKIRNEIIDNVQRYLSANYKTRLSLPDIAAQFYISPYYLSHLFKKTTSLSVVEYINSIRLMAAKKLIETTKLKISAVAEETGFTTTTHFSRIFKESTGISPQQYRKFYHSTLMD